MRLTPVVDLRVSSVSSCWQSPTRKSRPHRKKKKKKKRERKEKKVAQATRQLGQRVPGPQRRGGSGLFFFFFFLFCFSLFETTEISFGSTKWKFLLDYWKENILRRGKKSRHLLTPTVSCWQITDILITEKPQIPPISRASKSTGARECRYTRKNHGRQKKNRRMINKNPEKKKLGPQNGDFGR